VSANVCVRERWQEGEGGREQLHGQGDWSVEASDAKYTKRIAMRIGERPKVRDSRLEVGRGSRITLHRHAHVHAQAQAHATATERMLVRAKLQTRNRRYRSLVRQKPQRRLGPLQKRASTTRTTRRRICRRETRLRLPRQVVRGARDLSPRSSRRDGGRHRGRSGVRVVRRH
jgi:hypothetical protein